jgi:hypothetical protein
MKPDINRMTKLGAVACSTLCFALIAYSFATTAMPESFFEWLFVLIIVAPYLAVGVAGFMAPCDSLARVALFLAAIFSIPAGAVAYDTLCGTGPGWDDPPSVMFLWFAAPFELLLSLWVLGAVLLERRCSHGLTPFKR